MPEVSGAAILGGQVLLVGDETNQLGVASVPSLLAGSSGIAHAPLTGSLLSQFTSQMPIDDMEDVAADPVSSDVVWILTGHSPKKSWKKSTQVLDSITRRQLVRLEFEADGKTVKGASRLDIVPLIARVPALAMALARDAQVGGDEGSINFEGLAFDKSKSMYLGLRSPLAQKSAILLQVASPEVLTADKRPADDQLTPKVIPLDLGGRGIRGMAADRVGEGLWILAGLSENKDGAPTGDWDLYYRSRSGSLVKCEMSKPIRDVFQRVSVEVVAEVTRLDGTPGLLLVGDNDKGGPSPYVVIERPSV